MHIVGRTKSNWRPTPVWPYIDSDCPGRTVLHGALAVADIYEELNNLHEETVAIVLAQNREVKKHLLVLKKEISDTHNNLADLRTRSPNGFWCSPARAFPGHICVDYIGNLALNVCTSTSDIVTVKRALVV